MWPGAKGQETNDNLSLPGTDTQAASNLLGDKFPDQANGSVPIAFRAPAGTKLSDTRYKKPIERVTRAYSKDPAVTQTVGPFDEQGADQLNKKNTIGYISLNLKNSPQSSASRRHNKSSSSTARSRKQALIRRLEAILGRRCPSHRHTSPRSLA